MDREGFSTQELFWHQYSHLSTSFSARQNTAVTQEKPFPAFLLTSVSSYTLTLMNNLIPPPKASNIVLSTSEAVKMQQLNRSQGLYTPKKGHGVWGHSPEHSQSLGPLTDAQWTDERKCTWDHKKSFSHKVLYKHTHLRCPKKESLNSPLLPHFFGKTYLRLL